MGNNYIPVKTYLVEETKGESTYTYLVIKKPDGTKLSVDIFSGGGYVEQLMFNELPPKPKGDK